MNAFCAASDTDVDGDDDGSRRASVSGTAALGYAIGLAGALGITVESSQHGHQVLAADNRPTVTDREYYSTGHTAADAPR